MSETRQPCAMDVDSQDLLKSVVGTKVLLGAQVMKESRMDFVRAHRF